jgi:hypothetical protein
MTLDDLFWILESCHWSLKLQHKVHATSFIDWGNEKYSYDDDEFLSII